MAKKHEYNPDLNRISQSVIPGNMKMILIVITVMTFIGVFLMAQMLKRNKPAGGELDDKEVSEIAEALEQGE